MSVVSTFENITFKILKLLIIGITCFILIFNIFNYDQTNAYDYDLQYWIIQGLPSQLPTPEQNPNYYHPPLPYLLPSIIDSICDNYYQNDEEKICDFLWHKISQVFQSIMFLSTIFLYSKIFNLLTQKKSERNTFIFILLFILPTVNFKTVSMVRGKSYLAFFTVLLIYLIVRAIFLKKINFQFFLYIGLIAGLTVLTKQTSIYVLFGLIPSIKYLFQKSNLSKINFLSFSVISLILGLIVGGWFYIYQYNNNGTLFMKSRPSAEFSFQNHPEGYYTNFDLGEVIDSPIKYHKAPKLLQIIFLDTWGDYSGYYSWDKDRFEETAYINNVKNNLSKQMIYSLFPTTLIIVGFISLVLKYLGLLFKDSSDDEKIIKIIVSISISSIIGYLYFITIYPFQPDGSYNGGDILKATYVLPVINLMSVAGSYLIHNISKKYKNTSNVVLLFLFAYLVLSLQNMVTEI